MKRRWSARVLLRAVCGPGVRRRLSRGPASAFGDHFGRAGSLPRLGTHAELSGDSSRRSPISARCSRRKRAQSARRSSETNSPGSSGSGDGGDPGVARSRIHSPPRCGNCGNLACGTAGARLGSRAARTGDFTTLGPRVGSLERGRCGRILGKSANFCNRLLTGETLLLPGAETAKRV
jgi:hypothetical protein